MHNGDEDGVVGCSYSGNVRQ